MKALKNLTIVLLVGIAACSEDWLNVEPKDRYNDAAVWGNVDLANQFLYGIYLGIPYPHQTNMSYTVTDEGSFVWVDPLADRVTGSNMTPDDQGTFNSSVWAIGMMY